MESKIMRQDECKYCTTLLELIGQHREADHKPLGKLSNVETYEDLLNEVRENSHYHRIKVTQERRRKKEDV